MHLPPPQETHEYQGLVTMNRRDGQRLLLWTDGNIEKEIYVRNTLNEYAKRQFIDYLVLSTSEYQNTFLHVAKQMHLPVVDFDLERNKIQMSIIIRLIHHWEHMLRNGMPTAAIFFECVSESDELVLFRDFCTSERLPLEIVRQW